MWIIIMQELGFSNWPASPLPLFRASCTQDLQIYGVHAFFRLPLYEHATVHLCLSTLGKLLSSRRLLSSSPVLHGYFMCTDTAHAGDPLFGTLPANAQKLERIADRFSADRSAGNPYAEAHLSRQIQRPHAGVLPKGTRTLMQQRSHLFPPLFVEDLIGRVRARRFGLERRQSSFVKIGNGVANRLIATADETGNDGR